MRPRLEWKRVRLLALWCGLVVLSLLPTARATECYGQVFFGQQPVPGATVTVSREGKRLTTVTDQQGLYEFTDLSDGIWKIKIEMSGFSTLDAQITVGPDEPQGKFELQLLALPELLSRIQVTTPEAQQGPSTPPESNESTAASPPVAPASSEEANDESSDGLLINGSVNNAATSPFGLSPAFGNHRPGLKGLYNGSIGVIGDNSIFDARPYSLTGLEAPKDIYSRLTTLFTFGGPLKIPHLFYNGPYFFVAYQRTRNRDAATQFGLVPDMAERGGDLSGLTNGSGQPIPIYNPVTGMPFTGAIPVSLQAQALLNLYPFPNITGNSSYNYQTQVLSDTHVDALQARADKTIGRRDHLYGRFGYQSSRSDTANLFDFRDRTDTLGINTEINWSHQFRRELLLTVGYSFNRLRTQVQPQFENVENISGEAGITGNNQDPVNWGPPTLIFSSGIASLGDGESSFNRNRTDSLSLNMVSTQWHHTVTFGGDYRRREFNELGQQNPRGTFAFTGAATSAGGSSSGGTATSGSDLADFLLGIPDTSAVAFGNADKYFRGPVYDAYVSDDWKARPELTITAGVRWEYGAPLNELFGRLVNLDVAPGFADVAPVLGNSPTGPLTRTKYPNSLIFPDRDGFEPRLGIAWRPLPASTLVVRGGYGVYDDTSVYSSIVQQMAQQAPLSTSVSVANSSSCPLTLADGFRNCAGTTAETFGIDPHFRVGYAQEWYVSMQRDLPGALVMIVRYSGIKGTRGMQEFLPNTYPIGAANPCPTCPTGFVYLTSNGDSTREAGQIELRRRLRAGLTAKLDYTYAKAIDDDSQLGGQGHAVTASVADQGASESQTPAAQPTIAQDWLDLRAERGLSSFDQRHLINAQIQYTTGMGLGGGTLLGGWRGRLFKEWTVLTQITAGTGLPETPIFLATVPGTGVTGTIRPDLTGAPIYKAPPGYFLNAAAFSAPLPGEWGSAPRNFVTGPSQFSLDTAMARTFRLRGELSLDVRVQATNLLNHATFTSWNTTVNSMTFGLPAAVNPMRSFQLVGRLRF
ncbi:MAG TPA: carboxypeptidase regulatory-like domain-containing protein [Candidatus Aquilonibacter sp.]|nr:carboxypeptidase regulatory-like domain-containing protein [Candidatus Aquilonibacter sp.]